MTSPGRPLPDGRYGGGRRLSRRAGWLLGACGLTLGVLVAYLGYTNLASAPIETQRVGFESLPANAMRLTFEVVRDSPDRAVVCIVRARGLDGAETGRKEVLIAPGPSSTLVNTVVRGSTEPVTADVFGCSYQVPEYLSTAMRPTG